MRSILYLTIVLFPFCNSYSQDFRIDKDSVLITKAGGLVEVSFNLKNVPIGNKIKVTINPIKRTGYAIPEIDYQLNDKDTTEAKALEVQTKKSKGCFLIYLNADLPSNKIILFRSRFITGTDTVDNFNYLHLYFKGEDQAKKKNLKELPEISLVKINSIPIYRKKESLDKKEIVSYLNIKQVEISKPDAAGCCTIILISTVNDKFIMKNVQLKQIWSKEDILLNDNDTAGTCVWLKDFLEVALKGKNFPTDLNTNENLIILLSENIQI